MKRIVISIISILVLAPIAAQKPTARSIKSDPKAIAILDKAADKINRSACSTTLKMSIKEPEHLVVSIVYPFFLGLIVIRA